MARPLWGSAISFGLVNIPVKVYSAVKRKTLHFHQLRKSDGCRIRLKKVCSADDVQVENTDIIKGYEISPERYVTLSAQELESLAPKASRSIDIEDFVKLEEIDPLYFEQSYYLLPDRGSAKAYSLLLTAMREAQKVAIARFVIRNKQYLAAIRPGNQTLFLSTLFFADEIVALETLTELPEKESKPSEKELKIALQLIESLSSQFQPQKYHNEYHDQLMELIESKAEGETLIVQEPAQAEPGKVIDLMAALEASLSAMKEKKPAKARRKKASAQ